MGLSHGKPIEIKNHGLNQCIFTKDYEGIKRILEEFPESKDEPDEYLLLPIQLSLMMYDRQTECSNEIHEIISLLIQHNVDLYLRKVIYYMGPMDRKTKIKERKRYQRLVEIWDEADKLPKEDRENHLLYCHYYSRQKDLQFSVYKNGYQMCNSLDIAGSLGNFELVKILVEEGGFQAITCNPDVVHFLVYWALSDEERLDYLVHSSFKYDVNYDYEFRVGQARPYKKLHGLYSRKYKLEDEEKRLKAKLELLERYDAHL